MKALRCLVPLGWAPLGWLTLTTGGCAPSGPAAVMAGETLVDSGVAPGDSGVPPSDSGVAPGDSGVAPGDSGVAPGDSAVSLCPEVPVAHATTGAVLELSTNVVFRGQPLLIAQPMALAGGGSLTPQDFRFYVSNVAFTRTQGAPVDVDLVDATGAPEAYGVHLFNADDDTSKTIRLRAPAGEYTGMAFTLGLNDACNSATRLGLKPPLSASSQMSWPHLLGYLFLRFEGQVNTSTSAADAAKGDSQPTDAGPVDGAAFPLPAIHMGGLVGTLFAPTAHAQAALSIPANGTVSRHLQVVMEEVFLGASSSVDLTNFVNPGGGAETLAGERLRQTVPSLPIFELLP